MISGSPNLIAREVHIFVKIYLIIQINGYGVIKYCYTFLVRKNHFSPTLLQPLQLVG